MKRPEELNGSVLAFLGDAVLSLKVRSLLVSQGFTKPKDLQELSVRYVSAKAQAKFVRELLNEKQLDEKETLIYRRGRNFKSDSVPKNTDVTTYRCATGYEALWGYWYMTGQEDRLEQIWHQMQTRVQEEYGTIYLREKHGQTTPSNEDGNQQTDPE
jgi:ribonuclease-3 family protein